MAELPEHLDLSAWGNGSRLICRREHPHPGAQFQIFDEHGYRYTCVLTDRDDGDIAVLELRHRGARAGQGPDPHRHAQPSTPRL